MRTSWIYHGNPYTGKTTSLYWDRPRNPVAISLSANNNPNILLCLLEFQIVIIVSNLVICTSLGDNLILCKSINGISKSAGWCTGLILGLRPANERRRYGRKPRISPEMYMFTYELPCMMDGSHSLRKDVLLVFKLINIETKYDKFYMSSCNHIT